MDTDSRRHRRLSLVAALVFCYYYVLQVLLGRDADGVGVGRVGALVGKEKYVSCSIKPVSLLAAFGGWGFKRDASCMLLLTCLQLL